MQSAYGDASSLTDDNIFTHPDSQNVTVGSMLNQGGHRRAVGAVAAVKVARMPPTVT